MRRQAAILGTWAALLAAGPVMAGCGDGDAARDARERAGTPASRPAEDALVRGEVELDRAPAGAPDGGQAAGHRGGGPEGEVRGSSFAFRGRVRPATAAVSVRSAGAARASVDRATRGAFLVRVTGLRRGSNSFVVTATAPGHGPWREEVTIRRLGTEDPPTEPQAAEPDRGSPGAAEPSGGKVDIDLTAAGPRPAEARVRVGQIVVWRNEDAVRHSVTSTAPSGPASAQLNPGDRFEWTARRPGTVRYRSAPDPDVRGVLRVAP
jgi:plastocyanin